MWCFFLYRKSYGILLLYKHSINYNYYHGDKVPFNSKINFWFSWEESHTNEGNWRLCSLDLAWVSELPVFERGSWSSFVLALQRSGTVRPGSKCLGHKKPNPRQRESCLWPIFDFWRSLLGWRSGQKVVSGEQTPVVAEPAAFLPVLIDLGPKVRDVPILMYKSHQKSSLWFFWSFQDNNSFLSSYMQSIFLNIPRRFFLKASNLNSKIHGQSNSLCKMVFAWPV